MSDRPQGGLVDGLAHRNRRCHRRRQDHVARCRRGLPRPHRPARRHAELLRRGRQRRRARAAADAADTAQRRAGRSARCTACRSLTRTCITAPGRVSACGSSCAATARALYRDGAAAARRRPGRSISAGCYGRVRHGAARLQPELSAVPQSRGTRTTFRRGSSSGSGVAVGGRLVHAVARLGHRRLDPLPCAVSGVAGLLPTYGRVSRHGAMPMSHSLRRGRPAGAHRARLRPAAGRHRRRDPADASSLRHAGARLRSALSSSAPLPTIGIARGYFDDGCIPTWPRRSSRPRTTCGAPASVVEGCRPAGRPARRDRRAASAGHEGRGRGQPSRRRCASARPTTPSRSATACMPASSSRRRTTSARSSCAANICALRRGGLRQVDLILTPVLAIPVPTIAETTGRTGKDYLDMVVAITRNTKVVNYLGLPAISVPCGSPRTACRPLPADRPAAPGGRPAARRGPLPAGHGLAPPRADDDLKGAATNRPAPALIEHQATSAQLVRLRRTRQPAVSPGGLFRFPIGFVHLRQTSRWIKRIIFLPARQRGEVARRYSRTSCDVLCPTEGS